MADIYTSLEEVEFNQAMFCLDVEFEYSKGTDFQDYIVMDPWSFGQSLDEEG